MPLLCAGLMKLACIPLEIGNFEAMMNLLPPYMQDCRAHAVLSWKCLLEIQWPQHFVIGCPNGMEEDVEDVASGGYDDELDLHMVEAVTAILNLSNGK